MALVEGSVVNLNRFVHVGSRCNCLIALLGLTLVCRNDEWPNGYSASRPGHAF